MRNKKQMADLDRVRGDIQFPDQRAADAFDRYRGELHDLIQANRPTHCSWTVESLEWDGYAGEFFAEVAFVEQWHRTDNAHNRQTPPLRMRATFVFDHPKGRTTQEAIEAFETKVDTYVHDVRRALLPLDKEWAQGGDQ